LIAKPALALILVAAATLPWAAPAAAGQEPPEPAAGGPIRDADGNKIFDDLEERLAEAGPDETFSTIVLLHEPISPANHASLERLVGSFAIGHQYRSVNGFAAALTKSRIGTLVGHPLVKQIELDRILTPALDTATFWSGVQKARTDFGVDGNRDGLATYSTNDVVMAVLDSGIHAAHVDLDGGKVLAWRDFIFNNQAGPYDEGAECSYHGTHVSSTAAGEGQANPSFKGVAPGAALVGVKVLGVVQVPGGRICGGSTSQINAGIQWIIDNKATYNIRVFNMSLGGTGCSNGSDSQSQLVNAAVNAGMVGVVAAGNEGPATCTISSPAAAESAITVAAMADPTHGVSVNPSCPRPPGGFYLACFSSRGPTLDNRIKPDIAAPGVVIRAASGGTTNQYKDASGTSMATPFTAGVAALMLDANNSLTPSAVKSTLLNTAVDWGPPGKDIDYGAGRIDAYEALRSTLGSAGTGIAVPQHRFIQDSLAAHGLPGDTDNYTVKITNPSLPLAVTIITTSWNSNQAVDFDAILLDRNGLEVARSETTSRQETMGLASPSNGPYTLRIFAWEGNPPSAPPSLGGNYFFDLSAGGCIDNGAADLDGDAFSNILEAAVGTDMCSPCGADAWPADINNDGFSDISDVTALTGVFGQSVPPAPARYDIAPDPPDGFVDITDVSRMTGFFGQSCLP
jgi:serine protease AprX